MPLQDIRAALQARPFEPFLLVMTDGRTYEVRHPELVMLGFQSLAVGIAPQNAEEPVYERVQILALSHITRLEPVETTATQ
jgi:hypothetical protein